jgi:quercetin dioxygenase-like cupin family protein
MSAPEHDLDSAVPDWVIDHPGSLAIFQELGIDCSCGGKSLGYACRELRLDAGAVLARLARVLAVGADPIPLTTEDRTMAIPHAKPGEVIDVRPYGPDLAHTRTTTLFRSGPLEVIRIVMAAGKEIPEHKAPGAITVHCLEGKIAFTTLGETRELEAGQMLCIVDSEPHAVRCIAAGSFLLTLVRKPADEG